MQTKAFFIIVSTICLMRYESRTISNFMRPLVEANKVDSIIQEYQKKINSIFGFEMVRSGNIEDLLFNINNIQESQLPALKEFSGVNTVKDKLRTILERPKKEFNQETLKIFTNRLFNFYVHQNKFQKIATIPEFPIVFIKDAFNQLNANYIVSINFDLNEFFNEIHFYIVDTLEKKLRDYNNFSECKSNFMKCVSEYIFYYEEIMKKKITQENFGEIGDIVRGSVSFIQSEVGFQEVYEFGKVFIKAKHDEPKNKLLIDEILSGFFKVFIRASNVQDENYGKELFLSYFGRYLSISLLSNDFKNFISYKYQLDKLKLNLKSERSDYPDILKLYTIDVVSASYEKDRNFIRKADLNFIFENFSFFVSDFKSETFYYINDLRDIFVSNKDYLMSYYELFSGLYDSIILAAIEYNKNISGDKNHYYDTKSSIIFNDFLDYLLNWEKSLFALFFGKWEQDEKNFDTRIQSNYFFYKLVNLETFHKEFGKQIVFNKFTLFEDTIIHRFTLLPRYKFLIDFLRSGESLAFNYKIFSGKTISLRRPFTYSEKKLLADLAKKPFANIK